jgi:hypothetical protein
MGDGHKVVNTDHYKSKSDLRYSAHEIKLKIKYIREDISDVIRETVLMLITLAAWACLISSTSIPFYWHFWFAGMMVWHIWDIKKYYRNYRNSITGCEMVVDSLYK